MITTLTIDVFECFGGKGVCWDFFFIYFSPPCSPRSNCEPKQRPHVWVDPQQRSLKFTIKCKGKEMSFQAE